MYIWRKRVGSRWLDLYGNDLSMHFGGHFAVIEFAGRARAQVEILVRRRSDAERLRRVHGGAFAELQTDWFEQIAAQNSQVKPLRIGKRLVVLRSREQSPPGPGAIVIPAEAAFGTGEHATTAMSLRMLERTTRDWPEGWRMLDAGTGSGILAIAASRFGAGEVLAIELDPLACRVARRNGRANGTRHVQFRTGDVLQEKLAGKFDLITANLFSELLIRALPRFSRHLRRSGVLILSGILRSQETAVRKALIRDRFSVREARRRGKWIALLAGPTRKNS